MAKTAKLAAVLTLDSSPFFRGVNKAMAFSKAAARQFARQPFRTTAIIGGLGGAGAVRGISAGLVGLGNVAAKAFKYISVAGAGAAVAFAAGAAGAIHLGGELDDLSNRTGQTVATVLILRKAFQLAGLGADQVGALTNKLQKALSGVNDEGEPTNKEFAKLGLNIQALKRMDAVGQFEAIGAAINRLPDAADRAGAAMAIFGKGGGEVLQLFRDPSTFNAATEALGRQTGILQRNAAFFGAIEDKADRIKDKIQGFFVGVDDRIGLRLYAVLDKLGSVDLTKMGQGFGDAIGKGIDALFGFFHNPQLVATFLEQGFDYGVKAGGNILIAVFKSGLDFLQDGLISLWGGIGQIIIGTMIDAFKSPLAYLTAGIELALQKLPGQHFRDPAEEAVAKGDLDAAKRQVGYQQKNYQLQGIDKSDPEKYANDMRVFGQAVESAQKRLADIQTLPMKGTFDELYNQAYSDASQKGNVGDFYKSQGQESISEGISKAIEKARGMKVEDVLGAGASQSVMAGTFNAAARQGRKDEPQPSRQLNSHGQPFSDAELAQKVQLFGRKAAYGQVYGAAGAKMFSSQTERTPAQLAQDKQNYAGLYGRTAAEQKDREGFDFHSYLSGQNASSPVNGRNLSYGGNMGMLMAHTIGVGGALDGNNTSLSTGGLGGIGSATSTRTNGFDGNAFYQATGRIHGYSSMNTLRADAEKAGLNKKDPSLEALQATAKNTAATAKALGGSGSSD